MGFFPSYREFYQRALILIGENDRSSVRAKEANGEVDDFLTHWLIALEGNEANAQSDIYHWKVMVYPANTKGSFKYDNPYLVSPHYQSFHEAVDYIRELETFAKEDQLGNSLSIAN